MNKKGFTLIEIIISLTLIILIGGTVVGSSTPNYIIIRPAIVIKGDIIFTNGTGTSTDPFVLKVS